ncbi:MAG: hypothetical protein KBT33_03250 [Prevotellaceae bacterium]|nr:hypothetical protein [Candidatus Minthosoma equi]
MKALRTILTAVILLIGTMTMNAQRMSYEAMSSNARFLTDRMAYTLGIRDPFIIDDIYRINYDYIYGVNNYLDEVALGYYYEDYNSILLARDYALRNLLGDLLWNRLIGYSYFHRPIVFANRGWHFSIYDYDHHGPHHFFYSAPRPFGSRYAGGHFFHGMAPRGGHPGGAIIGGGRRGDFHDDHYRPQGNMNMNNRPNGNMNMNNGRPNGNMNMNNGRPQGNTIINVNNNNSRPNVGDMGSGRPNGNMNISGNDRPQDRPQGNINVNNNTRPQVNANGMNNNVSRPNTGNSFSSENRGGSFRSENNNRSSSRTFGGNNNIRPTSPSMSSSSRSSSSSMNIGSGTRSGGSFSSGSRGGSPSMGNNSRGGGSFSGGTRGGGSFGGGSHGGGSRMGGGRR